MALFLDEFNMVPIVSAAAPKAAPNPAGPEEPAEEEGDLYATAPRRTLASDLDSSASPVVQPSVELGATLASDGTRLAWHWIASVDEKGMFEVRAS